MFKKIVSICIVFSMVLLISPKQVDAQTQNITDSTIITGTNIYEVLSYLGLDSNSFEKTNFEGNHINTVGELKASINKFKNLPGSITVNAQGTILKENNLDRITNSIMALSPVSVRLLYTMNVGGSYTVDFTASATYSGMNWIAASNPNAQADSDFLLYVYKVTSQDLEVSITSDKQDVVMQGTIAVTIYAGVGDYGIVQIGRQVISPFLTWNVRDYYY